MVKTLFQKNMLKGSRQFDIDIDTITVTIKAPFNKEKLTVGLTTLNAEPVINQSYLEFLNLESHEPVFALYANKPNEKEFNAFVDTLKLKIQAAHDLENRLEIPIPPECLASNVHEEPPEFEELDPGQFSRKDIFVEVDKLDEAIKLLEQYLDNDSIKPLITALEALKIDPENSDCLEKVMTVFNGLGTEQGAVLTYAPYVNALLSDDPFAN